MQYHTVPTTMSCPWHYDEPVSPITVTVKDACRALGVKRTTLFGLLSQGRLQRIKIGRCTLVTTESLRNLVANSVDMPGER